MLGKREKERGCGRTVLYREIRIKAPRKNGAEKESENRGLCLAIIGNDYVRYGALSEKFRQNTDLSHFKNHSKVGCLERFILDCLSAVIFCPSALLT